MDIKEAMKARHSVRQYTDEPLSAEHGQVLEDLIARLNAESGLHMQLVTNEPQAFSSRMARYGKFSGVRNYLALAGPRGSEEACGYYGEQVVLQAQMLGLNSCWVGLTYKKIPAALQIGAGEKLFLVVALGYGANQGVSHKVKPAEKVSNVSPSSPEWFTTGVEAALLAPTAMNQQVFTLELCEDGKVSARPGRGFYVKEDLGIVKYHFEIGSGKTHDVWV